MEYTQTVTLDATPVQVAPWYRRVAKAIFGIAETPRDKRERLRYCIHASYRNDLGSRRIVAKQVKEQDIAAVLLDVMKDEPENIFYVSLHTAKPDDIATVIESTKGTLWVTLMMDGKVRRDLPLAAANSIQNHIGQFWWRYAGQMDEVEGEKRCLIA